MMNAKRSSNMNLTRYFFLVPAVIVLLLVFTVSRAALIKKHLYVATPHASTVVKTERVNFIVKRSPKLTAAKASGISEITKINPDTTLYPKVTFTPDTGKKLHIRQKNGELIIEQPSMYIVDGTILKDYDISKVDTTEIESINIGKSPDGKTVVYVRTKNGVDSKPIKAIRINGHIAENLKGVTIQGRLAYIDTLKFGQNNRQLDTVYFNYTSRPSKFNTSVYKVQPFTTKGPINVRPIAKVSGRSLNTVYTTSIVSPDEEVTLSDLSNKLIIINGNVASKSDLKKLSAFDIDRMVLKTDKETKELYGDKGKNGVVFILTKKRG